MRTEPSTAPVVSLQLEDPVEQEVSRYCQELREKNEKLERRLRELSDRLDKAVQENAALQSLLHVESTQTWTRPLDVLDYFLAECKKRFGRAPHVHDREKVALCGEIERFRVTRGAPWSWDTYRHFVDACLASYAPPNFVPQLRHITSPKMLDFIERKQATKPDLPAARNTPVTRADRINWAAVRQQGARSGASTAH